MNRYEPWPHVIGDPAERCSEHARAHWVRIVSIQEYAEYMLTGAAQQHHWGERWVYEKQHYLCAGKDCPALRIAEAEEANQGKTANVASLALTDVYVEGTAVAPDATT